MAIVQVKALLTGFTGAPGVNTLNFQQSGILATEDVEHLLGLVSSAYNTVRQRLANGVKVDVSPEVTVFNTETGTIISQDVYTAPSAQVGYGSGSESRASHAKLKFRTDVVVDGRPLRGGPYIGPISSDCIDDTGAFNSTARNQFVTMFDGVMDVDGFRLVVWHRPKSGAAADGVYGNVQRVSLSQQPAVLRSRRD